MPIKTTPIFDPYEISLAEQKILEIRFDCIVKMCARNQEEEKPFHISVFEEPALKPQAFKSEAKLSLDFIKYSEPMQIGLMMKEMLIRLENEIEKHYRS